MAELKFPVTELDKDKFQVVVDLAIYAKESLVAACYKFTDRFYIHQQTSGNNVIAIFEANDGNVISDVIVKQFCNELIDQQVRFSRFTFVQLLVSHLASLKQKCFQSSLTT